LSCFYVVSAPLTNICISSESVRQLLDRVILWTLRKCSNLLQKCLPDSESIPETGVITRQVWTKLFRFYETEGSTACRSWSP
jgi:hypothetical protein